MAQARFNPPPGWPAPPAGWRPPEGWAADPAWPAPPPGWVFWVLEEDPAPPAGVPASSRADEVPATSAHDAVEADHAVPATAPPSAAEGDALGPVLAEIDARREELRALDRHVDRLRQEAEEVRQQGERAKAELKEDLVELNDALMLQHVGIYEYHHPLENAEMYRARLASLQGRVKATVKAGAAVVASEMFSYNNSLALGRRMTGEFSKLVLRAYNAEADSSVRSLRAGNLATAQQRIDASASAIAKLGAMMQLRISPEYHQLRLDELELTADYLMKVQEEREQVREERERLREERKAEEELARERERLAKERSHYLIALQTLQEQGTTSQELEERLAAIDEAIAQNEFRAANIRAGYVYVISNIGAFGSGVVKIGMTRRLDPLERIRELGDAPVPFPFDVHAIYFSEDAVALEGELHGAFAARRLNHVNFRREFFFATPVEVRAVLAEKVGNLLEFTERPEASQYFQSSAAWPARATSEPTSQ